MTSNFDINSEAMAKYLLVTNSIGNTDGLEIDVSTEDDEEPNIVELNVIKKADNRSTLTMRSDDQEIRIDWNGERLSASSYDTNTGDSDKMEVPTAINAVMDIYQDYVIPTPTFSDSGSCGSINDIDDEEDMDEDIDDELDETLEEPIEDNEDDE